MTGGRGLAPLPVFVLVASACALVFATDHPIIVAAIGVGALLLHLATPDRSRLSLIVGAIVGLGVFVLNPFVQANGDLVLIELPDIPILDLQVTLEEVVAGLVMGLRAFAVTVLIGAALSLVDPDRLLSVAGRLLPRSALVVSIAARMLPSLTRDAASLDETMRLRGFSITAGGPRARTRAAATLAVPLVGSALERSLDVAEAMAARGYGSGPRTQVPQPPTTRREWTIAATSAPVAAVAALAITGRLGEYHFYPTLDQLGSTAPILAAAVAVGMLGVAAWTAAA